MACYTYGNLKRYGGELVVNANELKAAFKQKAYTQEEVAKLIGMSSRTLRNKLNKGVFESDEIEKLIAVLEIKDPMPIFFDGTVT